MGVGMFKAKYHILEVFLGSYRRNGISEYFMLNKRLLFLKLQLDDCIYFDLVESCNHYGVLMAFWSSPPGYYLKEFLH
jgi:hypothetical protein